MKRPTSVQIGGLRYKIKFSKRSLDKEFFGRTFSGKQEILINNDEELSIDRQRQTLLHELVHAISAEYLETARLELSEQQVLSLAQGLYQVLKGNSKVAKFILPNL